MGKKKKKKLKVKRKNKNKNKDASSEKVYDYNKLSDIIGDIIESADGIISNNEVVENLDSNGYKVLYDLFNRVESIVNSAVETLDGMEHDPCYKMNEATIKHLKGLVK